MVEEKRTCTTKDCTRPISRTYIKFLACCMACLRDGEHTLWCNRRVWLAQNLVEGDEEL